MKTFFKIFLVIIGLLIVVGYFTTPDSYEQPETRNEWLSSLVIAVCATLDWDYDLIKSLPEEEDKIVWLENNIKKVPADRVELNEDIYRLLAKARPTNEQYPIKYVYYRTLGESKLEKEKDEKNEIVMQVEVAGSTPISTYPNSDIYIGKIPNGTKVEILETVIKRYGGTVKWNVEWYRVKYLDKEGWISEACTKGYKWKMN